MDLDMPNNPAHCLGVGDTTALSLAYAPSNLYAGYKKLSVNTGGVIEVLQGSTVVISGTDKQESWVLRSGSDPSTLTVKGVSPGQATLTLQYTTDGFYVPCPAHNGDSVTVRVVEVDKIQYQDYCTEQYVDVTGTLYIVKGYDIPFKAIPYPSGSWPNDAPRWMLDGVLLDPPGETKSINFSTLSASPTDYHIVTATCGTSSVTVNVICFDFAGTLTPVDNFAYRSQDRYGLAERVNATCAITPSGLTAATVGGLMWSTWFESGYVGSFISRTPDNGTAIYDAGPDAGPTQPYLYVLSGASCGISRAYSKTVVAPSGGRYIKMPPTGIWHVSGHASIGFKGLAYLSPKDVSFQNLLFREGEVWAQLNGFFSGAYPNGLLHPATDPPSEILGGDYIDGCQVEVSDNPYGDWGTGPFSEGYYTWDIPWQYQAPGTTTWHTFGSPATHRVDITSSGTVTIQKKIQGEGAGPFTKNLDDPSSDYSPPP